MSILAWIALGLLGGLGAGWVVWRGRGRTLAGDGTVGALGALLGGFMASVTLGLDVVELNLTSLLVAAVGATLLILVLHTLPPTELFD